MNRWHVKRRNGAWWIRKPDGTFWDVDLYDLAGVLDRVRLLAGMTLSAQSERACTSVNVHVPSLCPDEGPDFAAQVDEWAKGNRARWSE